MSGMKVVVKDGVGRASFPAPAYVRFDSSANLAGYWVEKNQSSHSSDTMIPPGSKPYRITYKAKPCGGIVCDIIDHQGEPVHGMNFSISPIYSQPQKRPNESLDVFKARYSKEMKALYNFHRAFSLGSKTTTQAGTFSFTSLPIGHTYVVIAESDSALSISDKIEVTEENPIPHTSIRLPEPLTVAGRVLNPDGTPAAKMHLELDSRITIDDVRRSRNTLDTVTDEDGKFVFDGILPHPYINYTLKVKTGEGIAPIFQTVEPGEEVALQLKKGFTIKGRVVDHETGKPIAGVLVSTSRQSRAYDTGVSTETDSEGLFSCSPLSDGEYVIDVFGMEITSPATTNQFFTTYTAGEIDFLELTVKPMTNLPHFKL
jgi:protocatechuate 3,4-dioxygenase beta subunit